jgi:hypothetical protein
MFEVTFDVGTICPFVWNVEAYTVPSGLVILPKNTFPAYAGTKFPLKSTEPYFVLIFCNGI